MRSNGHNFCRQAAEVCAWELHASQLQRQLKLTQSIVMDFDKKIFWVSSCFFHVFFLWPWADYFSRFVFRSSLAKFRLRPGHPIPWFSLSVIPSVLESWLYLSDLSLRPKLLHWCWWTCVCLLIFGYVSGSRWIARMGRRICIGFAWGEASCWPQDRPSWASGWNQKRDKELKKGGHLDNFRFWRTNDISFGFGEPYPYSSINSGSIQYHAHALPERSKSRGPADDAWNILKPFQNLGGFFKLFFVAMGYKLACGCDCHDKVSFLSGQQPSKPSAVNASGARRVWVILRMAGGFP